MRFYRILVPAVLTLSACGGGEEEIEQPNPAEIEARAKAKAKRQAARKAKAEAEKEVQPTLELAIGLSQTGKVDEALAMLKVLLTESPETPAFWEATARIGISHGRQAALLAEFDAETAIGGQTELHHRLRAQLAVAASDSTQILAAIGHLSDAEEIAAYRAREAAISGTLSVDIETLDPETPEGRLLLASTETNRAKKARLLDDLSVSQRDAKLYLAELVQQSGDSDRAAELYAELTADDAQDSVAYSAHLKLWGAAETAGEKAVHSEALMKNAWSSGDSANALAHFEHVRVDSWNSSNSATPFALATALFEGTQEANASLRRSALSAYGNAALTHGRPDAALSTAKLWSELCFSTETQTQGEGEEVEEVEVQVADQDCLEAAHEMHTIAAFQLGLADEIAESIGTLEEALGADHAVNNHTGLHRVLTGSLSEAESMLDPTGPHAITLALARARAVDGQDKSPISELRSAVSIADASGYLPNRVRTRLLLANELAGRQENGALSTTLSELQNIAESLGEQGAHLAREVLGRRVMAGLRADTSNDTVFAALNGEAEVPDATEGEHRLLTWARARSLAQTDAGAAIAAYTEAIKTTPPIHQGPWANLSVQNGRSGPGVVLDIAAILASPGDDAGLLALPLHDWWHEKEMMNVAFAVGDDPSAALSAEERIGFNQSLVNLQHSSIQWLIGQIEDSSAAESAFDAALASAMETKSFQRGVPEEPMDYSTVPQVIRSKAVLSYRLGAKSGEAIVVTKSGSTIKALDNVDRIRANADSLRRLLRSGESHGGQPLLPGKAADQKLAQVGDALRADLLDIFTQELQGVGIYLLLFDSELMGLPFGVMPEQRDAARFIADIRGMSHATTAGAGLRSPSRPKLNYGTDVLGISPFRPEPDPTVGTLSIPGEAQNATRLFGQGVRVYREAEKATAELLESTLDDARFIHVTDFKTGDHGGIQMSDNTVSLATVRSKDITTQVTILSSDSSPKHLMRQAHAFYRAGATNLVLSNRLIDEQVRGRYLYNFYEAINRERPPVMALSEARKTMASDSAHNGYFDPSWWGQFILYGNPS
ncbi:MAG: CHAT domain-containing protein [Myxococcota bacterium]|nr:CHAT domain-containing protein [Myxococcota bacterium]